MRHELEGEARIESANPMPTPDMLLIWACVEQVFESLPPELRSYMLGYYQKKLAGGE